MRFYFFHKRPTLCGKKYTCLWIWYLETLYAMLGKRTITVKSPHQHRHVLGAQMQSRNGTFFHNSHLIATDRVWTCWGKICTFGQIGYTDQLMYSLIAWGKRRRKRKGPRRGGDARSTHSSHLMIGQNGVHLCKLQTESVLNAYLIGVFEWAKPSSLV